MMLIELRPVSPPSKPRLSFFVSEKAFAWRWHDAQATAPFAESALS